MADQDTRHKLPRGCQGDGLADRLLKLTFPSQCEAQHFRHLEITQRFAILRRLNSVQVTQPNALNKVQPEGVVQDAQPLQKGRTEGFKGVVAGGLE